MVLSNSNLIGVIEIQTQVVVRMQNSGIAVLVQVKERQAGKRVEEKCAICLRAPAPEGDDADGVEGKIGQGTLA